MSTARAPLKAGSQCSQVLAWLTRGRTLTPIVAFDRLRICALSQRIGELRRRGHPIVSTMVKVGDKTVARYRLEGR